MMKIILEMSSYIFTIQKKKKIGNVCDMCIMLIFEISISCGKKKIINETALNINKGSDWKNSIRI